MTGKPPSEVSMDRARRLCYQQGVFERGGGADGFVELFALALDEEREGCAVTAKAQGMVPLKEGMSIWDQVAAAIRARGVVPS